MSLKLALALLVAGCSGRRSVVDARVEATAALDAAARPTVDAPPPPPPPATLREAALRCDLGGAKQLLARGADVEEVNAELRTPLHEAAGRCTRDVVELLVGAGARVNVADFDGLTPLHEACAASRLGAGNYALFSAGDPRVVAFLLARGADPRSRARNGWTPLHAAAQVPRGGAEVVTLLVDAGAPVDAADPNGWTPLHHAARVDGVDVARVLAARGASLAARTTAARTIASQVYAAGATPRDVARQASAARVLALPSFSEAGPR